MDQNTSSVLGIVALIISIGTTIIGIINHKKIKSRCCSRKIEIEFDIESTRPTSVHPQPSPKLTVRQNSETN